MTFSEYGNQIEWLVRILVENFHWELKETIYVGREHHGVEGRVRRNPSKKFFAMHHIACDNSIEKDFLEWNHSIFLESLKL